ncbi:MAG: hypothetical protein JWP12_2273 [Bacteroidetes bacterium]|nr:hypothetical protein [Bacteroidota bacterium]
MKNLVKISLVCVTILAFASCRKTDFDDVTPGNVSNHTTKLYHDGSTDDSNVGGTMFTDRDKCKKCHGGTTASGKSLDINWKAPYMSNGEYASIEELVNNFDFVNDVHLRKSDANSLASKTPAGITTEQKQQLIDYLKNLAAASAGAATK